MRHLGEDGREGKEIGGFNPKLGEDANFLEKNRSNVRFVRIWPLAFLAVPHQDLALQKWGLLQSSIFEFTGHRKRCPSGWGIPMEMAYFNGRQEIWQF